MAEIEDVGPDGAGDETHMNELLADPTRCYVRGCVAENEILLHLSNDPPGFADLCWSHSLEVVATSEIVATCVCEFCKRARRRLSSIQAVLAGDGSYDELDEYDQAIVRGQWDLRIKERIAGLDFAAEFAAAGESWSEADADGNVVIKGGQEPEDGPRDESGDLS